MQDGTQEMMMTNTESKKARSPHQPTGCWVRPAKRVAIYLRDEFHCLYCGKNLKNADPNDVTLDHLLPRVAGGTNDATNLVTACKSCNSSRSDRPWVDYATGGAVERIQQRRHEALNIPLAKALIAGTAGDAEVEALR